MLMPDDLTITRSLAAYNSIIVTQTLSDNQGNRCKYSKVGRKQELIEARANNQNWLVRRLSSCYLQLLINERYYNKRLNYLQQLLCAFCQVASSRNSQSSPQLLPVFVFFEIPILPGLQNLSIDKLDQPINVSIDYSRKRFAGISSWERRKCVSILGRIGSSNKKRIKQQAADMKGQIAKVGAITSGQGQEKVAEVA